MKTYFSGINPSSTKGLHLGNYFGMAKPALDFQDKGSCIYFIANLHTLNSVYDPIEVKTNTEQVFMEFLALGLDPTKTLFFVQSDVPAVPYLQTILNNVVTVSELKLMHAYKDKLQNDVAADSISMGLFSYPVLMAADILFSNPDYVPVGQDQAQHVELAREIARTFNNRYGEVFKIPEVYLTKETARIKGTDGERKMSKSLGNDIPIFAPEEVIKKQIMSITTDPARIHPTDPGDPAKNVTFEYLELLGYDAAKVTDMKEQYKQGTIGDVEIKKQLFGHFMEYFADVRKKRAELDGNRDYLHELRARGAKQANEIAEATLKTVRRAVGV
ncbi:MAG: tryptophan--tRNA ligase [Weeksellaceae bacterium]